MGLWNTHGMSENDQDVEESISLLGITSEEMAAMVEHCQRETWVWEQLAKRKKGQEKRKANLIVKHLKLRTEKWIELVAKAEMDYEHESERGIFYVAEEESAG